jgi:hypothetical protein
MADRRTYVRLHDGLPDHPKIAEVGGEAAWLYVSGLCYCSRQLTDGMIPARMVARLTDLSKSEALASRLLEANLWHPASHDCKDCPQGIGDVYVVHDYLDHQRSAAEVRELSEKRAAAGQRGGKASGATRRSEAKHEASASGSLEANGKQNEAETETETDIDKKKTSSSSSGAQSATKRRTRSRANRPVAPRFDEFYRAYPRREAPGEAEAAWTKAIEDVGADPQLVIDAAALYAISRKGQDATYTKLPATWLNKRCWEDEPKQPHDARASGGYQAYLEDPDDERPYAGNL